MKYATAFAVMSGLCCAAAPAVVADDAAAAQPAPQTQAKAPDVARGFILKTVHAGGKDLRYSVYIPQAYDPAKPMPTIMFLNGMGEVGTDGIKQLSAGLAPNVMANPDKWPFIIVFPQKQTPNEDWDAYEPYAMAALAAVRADYNVDPARIYLTGISQGGHGAWAIGSMHTDIFAAIAPICGWGTEDIANKLAAAKTPIWMFHGGDDKTQAAGRSYAVEETYKMEKWLKAAGADYKMTIYPGVQHVSWNKAYGEENLYDWFLAHSKTQPSAK